MRWYCWFVFCIVAILSTWAFPAESNVDETDLLTIDNEQQGDFTVENRILSEEDEDDDDDDDDDDTLDITGLGRHHGKPQKHKKDKHDSSSSEEKNKHGKKPKSKCKCFHKKPNKHQSSGHPHQQGLH
jgi:hypothetical protein